MNSRRKTCIYNKSFSRKIISVIDTETLSALPIEEKITFKSKSKYNLTKIHLSKGSQKRLIEIYHYFEYQKASESRYISKVVFEEGKEVFYFPFRLFFIDKVEQENTRKNVDTRNYYVNKHSSNQSIARGATSELVKVFLLKIGSNSRKNLVSKCFYPLDLFFDRDEKLFKSILNSEARKQFLVGNGSLKSAPKLYSVALQIVEGKAFVNLDMERLDQDLMELGECLGLQELILQQADDTDKEQTEQFLLRVIRKVILLLKDLFNKKGLIQFDLKPENLMISLSQKAKRELELYGEKRIENLSKDQIISLSEEDFEVKLIDLLSVKQVSTLKNSLRGYTPGYYAPEVIAGMDNTIERLGFDIKAAVYSLGITILAMFGLKPTNREIGKRLLQIHKKNKEIELLKLKPSKEITDKEGKLNEDILRSKKEIIKERDILYKINLFKKKGYPYLTELVCQMLQISVNERPFLEELEKRVNSFCVSTKKNTCKKQKKAKKRKRFIFF